MPQQGAFVDVEFGKEYVGNMRCGRRRVCRQGGEGGGGGEVRQRHNGAGGARCSEPLPQAKAWLVRLREAGALLERVVSLLAVAEGRRRKCLQPVLATESRPRPSFASCPSLLSAGVAWAQQSTAMASRPPPPSAPTRSRRLPTRQAAPSSVNNSSTSPDELADDLTSLRITNAPTFKPLSSAAPTVPASRRLPPSSRPLALSKPPAAKAAPPAPASSLSPSERGKQAMRTVNTSLQTLAGVSKSGWRAIPISAAPSHSSRPTPLKLASSSSSLSSMASATQNKDRVDAAVGACGAALMTLRQLIREGKINNRATEVEKAAGSSIANLVEMELVSNLCFPDR